MWLEVEIRSVICAPYLDLCLLAAHLITMITIPLEVFESILEAVSDQPTLLALCLVHRAWYCSSVRQLYRAPKFNTDRALAKFMCTQDLRRIADIVELEISNRSFLTYFSNAYAEALTLSRTSTSYFPQPKLAFLKISNCYPLEKDDLDQFFTICSPFLHTLIIDMHVEYGDPPVIFDLTFLTFLAPPAQHLRALNLSGCDWLNDYLFLLCILPLSSLRALSLGRCKVTAASLALLACSMPALEIFEMAHLGHCGDNVIAGMCREWKGMRRLALTNTKAGPKTLEAIEETMEMLEELWIFRCHNNCWNTISRLKKIPAVSVHCGSTDGWRVSWGRMGDSKWRKESRFTSDLWFRSP